MVYTLDPPLACGRRACSRSLPVPEPDFIKLRDAKMAALSKMGIPDVLVRAMQRPDTVRSRTGRSRASPASARAGDARRLAARDRQGQAVRVRRVGGRGQDSHLPSTTSSCLDMQAKTWTQIFRCDIDDKLAAGRWNVMVPGADGSAHRRDGQGRRGRARSRSSTRSTSAR